MTTPTQAQIEAAAKAIWDAEHLPSSIYEEEHGRCCQLAEAALTAAAQVGEPTISSRWKPGDKELWNEAIERCKRVVEDILGPSDPRTPEGHDVLIALERLKDET